MRHILMASLLLAVATVGCGSSSTPGTGTGGTSGTGGTNGTTYTLTIQNYLDWCNVTENGTAYDPPAEPPAMSFPAGTVVHLMGDATSATFVWGYWVGTDGDTGASHDTNMTTTVTMKANTIVQACCPFTTAPTTPCPAP